MCGSAEIVERNFDIHVCVVKCVTWSKEYSTKATYGWFEVLQCYKTDKKLSPKEIRQIQ